MHTDKRVVHPDSHAMLLIVVSSVVLLYVATLTADYYWDGITFALHIEKVAKMERGGSLLFHQNHLLYEGIGYVIYCITRTLGSPIRSLYLLQAANVFAGGVAVGVFFRIAECLTRNRYAAVISSALLAFSAVWWKLVTDANAYVVSILLMLICAATLFSNRPRWIVAGLTLAGAVLVHQLASIFYPATLVAVATSSSIDKKWKFAGRLSAVSWGTTLAAYYFCASFLHGIRDPLGVIRWAVSNSSGVSPSWNPLHGLAVAPRGNLDMIAGHDFALYRSQGGLTEKLATLAALLSGVCFLIMFVRRVRTPDVFRRLFTVTAEAHEHWKACGLTLLVWIGSYSAFLLFWEPWQILYRAFHLPPLALLVGLVLSNNRDGKGFFLARPVAALLVTLALFNLAFFILPHMKITSNPRVAAARSANNVWNARTVIYFSDHNEADTAFEYFNEQTEWRRFNAAARAGIDQETERLSSEGGQVWLNKGAAESVDPEWLAQRTRGRGIVLESLFAPARYVELAAKR